MSSNKAISSALVSSPPLLVQSKTGNQNKSVMCQEGCSVLSAQCSIAHNDHRRDTVSHQKYKREYTGKMKNSIFTEMIFCPSLDFLFNDIWKSQTDRQGAICSSYRMVYNVGGSSIVLLTILSPSAILLGISVGNSVIDENMFLRWCQVYVRVGQCTMRLSMKIKETKNFKK